MWPSGKTLCRLSMVVGRGFDPWLGRWRLVTVSMQCSPRSTFQCAPLKWSCSDWSNDVVRHRGRSPLPSGCESLSVRSEWVWFYWCACAPGFPPPVWLTAASRCWSRLDPRVAGGSSSLCCGLTRQDWASDSSGPRGRGCQVLPFIYLFNNKA